MTNPQPADMQVSQRKRSPLRNLSVVWLVPIIALLVTLVIAWQSWAERGSLIEIRFENAAGVVQDSTTIRYRDVVIGQVDSVEFASDLSSVVVSARIDKTVAGSLPEDAQFWVVRPEVSASGISGLSTVLSGVYIEAGFTPQAGANATSFDGLDATPLVRPGVEGTRIIIRTSDGTMLTAGSPIFHQGIEVGRIETPRLLDSGSGVIVDAFIEAPHDRRITTATRFWDTSGFKVNFGPGGLNLSVGSVAALLRGGLAFDTVFSGGGVVNEGYIFDLFESEEDARESVFADAIENAVEVTVEFDESVRGLQAGSPVNYRGLRVGAVSALGAFIDETDEGQTVRLRAAISLDPRSFGLDPETPPADTIAFLANAVQKGLRARLASQSIFNTTLVVELVDLPDAEPATLGIFDQDAPLIPSVDSDIPDVAATAEGLLNRVNDLPVEELMEQAISTLASIESLAANDDLRAVPASVTSLLDETRNLLGSEATQALPAELGAAVESLRAIVDDLRTADAAGALVSALEAASGAADEVTNVAGSVEGALGDLPALLDDLRQLSAKANGLPLEELVSQATGVLSEAEDLIGSEAAQAVPAQLGRALDQAGGALDELRAVAVELREKQAIDRLTEALASASAAADEVTQVARNVEGATTELPELVDDLRALTQKANQLNVEELVRATTDFLNGADRLIDTPQARALPESLSATLDEARLALAELREGGLVDNANATLASAREAAAAIEDAARSLPQLSTRINALVTDAGVVLNSYGDNSEFNRETVAALRDVRDAATALSKLARAIERNPNSLLFGR